MSTRNAIQSWFKLANYDHVKDFTFDDWRTAICNRVACSYILSQPVETLNDESSLAAAAEHWEEIRRYGLECNRPKQIDPVSTEGPLSIIRTSRDGSASRLLKAGSVRDLSEFDVFGDVLDRKNLDVIQKDWATLNRVTDAWFLAFKRGDTSLLKKREELWDKYQTPLANDDIYEGQYGFAEIDFSASDEQLIDDFKNWLAMHRAAEPVNRRKGRVTEVDLNDWANAKILPYFDLVTICALDGHRLTNHLVGDLLFPNDVDVDVAERVRKVTKRKVAEVVCYEMVSLLEIQCKK